MAINTRQLNEYIVTPTLQELTLYSDSARNLILGTCAQESAMGTYIHQINGPALGIYQCEPDTFKDIWINFLSHRGNIIRKLEQFTSLDGSSQLIHNLKYATAICRIHYLRVKEALPDADDVEGLANYYKKYYNTLAGKGTVDQFIDNYYKYGVDKL